MIAKRYASLAALTIGALLTTGVMSAKDKVERPLKFQAQGTMVVSLIDDSYEAVESGQATHIGRFENNYTGYFDLDTLLFISGSGSMTAANGDELFWRVTAPSGAGEFTGGTGRFENATGAFTWLTTDLIITVDLDSRTLTITYNYTGNGTVMY